MGRAYGRRGVPMGDGALRPLHTGEFSPSTREGMLKPLVGFISSHLKLVYSGSPASCSEPPLSLLLLLALSPPALVQPPNLPCLISTQAQVSLG